MHNDVKGFANSIKICKRKRTLLLRSMMGKLGEHALKTKSKGSTKHQQIPRNMIQ